MKRFDAMKTMRDIRAQLSERYTENAKQQFEDLRRIREKHDIHPSPPSVKRPAVAEDEAKYGANDSE